MDDFVHLHVHGDNSLLDGAGKVKDYAGRAAILGQPALAVTDHGSLSGAMTHWKACNAVGVKPIIGCEFYVAPESRLVKERVRWNDGSVPNDADVSGSGAYTHLTVLAKDAEGLRNLYRLQHRAYAEGFYRKPRIDNQLLEECRRGLIVLSGCAGSAISTRLRLGQREPADALVDYYRSIFEDNFFIEVMHHGISFEDALNRDLIELAHRHSVKVVATNDAHYCTAEQAPVHAALLCVQSQSTLAAPAFQFDGHDYYLRSRAEMEAVGLPAESLDNTLGIAERVGSYGEVFERRLRFPLYPVPDGWTSEEALKQLAEDGLIERRGGELADVDRQQLAYETDVINSMGYPDYFLVLASILKPARAEGIRIGPGRGSAGGSLVAYAMGITDLDPIAHGLIFERFLNPERVSLPDVDIDVSDRSRPRLLEIARELYGVDHVAQIGTVGTIGAKAALKDANRVLGGTFTEGARRTASLPPPKFGRQPSLADYTGPQDEVYRVAVGLEGLIRNEGIHAAGVVVSPEPLADILPIRLPKGTEPAVTCFTDKEVEALGLVKMDFLGLRNLEIIDDCLQMLRNSGIQVPRLPNFPVECNDPRTYELLSRGDTLGVFQLDSPGMRGLLRLVRPTTFDDISACIALYRPGPMGAGSHTEFAHRKNGKEPTPIHPDLDEALRPVLSNTYGLIVFQEQVLGALAVVCGWSYAEAALLFDAMRKKNHEKMEATRPAYESAAASRGYSPEASLALWNTLVPFADYSFNRAHSAGYGLVAYWTAHLKAHHPTEYMAAVLSSVAEDKDRLPEYLAECQRMGIALVAPDVNRSGVGFSPGVGMSIHYGIGAIKGVGEAAYDALQRKRPYRDLDDFFKRANAKVLNSGVLGALVRSGATDSLTPLREELYVARDSLAVRALAYRAEVRAGQVPLYRVSFGVGESNLYSLDARQQGERDTLSTVLTYGSVDLVPKRRLGEAELIWLKDLIRNNPGSTKLCMKLGSASVKLPSADWSRIESAVGALELFEG